MSNAAITPDDLLHAYAAGIFPMADSAEDPDFYWVEPTLRGILPLPTFHISHRLRRTVRTDRFEVRANVDFDAVVGLCAAPQPGRKRTWINAEIRRLYGALFAMGHCHTVECFAEGTRVGGLYGVHLGAAFFGESMFHIARDASKVALVHLVARMIRGGFQLLDTQFTTEHLEQFGVIEMPRAEYRVLLRQAVSQSAHFDPSPMSGAEALAIIDAYQRRTATSSADLPAG